MHFAHELVGQIKDGTKTFTYRLGDKYDFLQTGDQIDVVNSSNERKFGKIEIIYKTKRLFKELPINQEGHESYDTEEEMRGVFGKYYGKKINDNEEFCVFEFRFIE